MRWGRSLCAGLACILGVLGLAGCTDKDDPAGTVMDRPTERWRFDAEEGDYVLVATDGTRVFGAIGPDYQREGDRGLLVGLDLRTGRELWRKPVACSPLQPAVGGGVLVVGCSTGQVFGLAVATGQQLWTYESRGAPVIPLIQGDTVFFGDLDPEQYLLDINPTVYAHGDIYAVGLMDGRERWRVETGRGSVWLAAEGDAVYAATYGAEGELMRLDAATGAERWRTPLQGGQAPPIVFDGGAAPMVTADSVIVAAAPGFQSRAKSDGKLLWDFEVYGTAASPIVEGDTVVTPTNNSQVLGVDTRTGVEKWRGEGCDCQYHTTLRGSRVLVTSSGLAQVNPRTGALDWWFRADVPYGGGLMAVAHDEWILQGMSRDGILIAYR